MTTKNPKAQRVEAKTLFNKLILVYVLIHCFPWHMKKELLNIVVLIFSKFYTCYAVLIRDI